MRSKDEFATLKWIEQLCEKMINMKKDIVYPLVYKLVILSFILLIVTAIVGITFLAMNVIKNSLCNQMRDQWMNDYLVTYIENDIFDAIINEEIMLWFQNMKIHWGQLKKLILNMEK